MLRAGDARAVGTQRHRKVGDDKQFALMAGDLAAAEALCELSDPARAAGVAPPSRPGARVGGILPPSPLHLPLAGGLGRPRV